MAEDYGVVLEPGALFTDEAEPAEAPKRYTRPALVPKSERDEEVERILGLIHKVRNERTDWMTQRVARYVKTRGWKERVGGPWEGSSDQHIPLIMANVLRVTAGLHNAVLGLRPVVTGRPLDSSKQDVAVRNNSLLDYQMFVENEGEASIGRFIQQFVEDGTVISYQPRVVERGEVVDVRRVKKDITADLVTLAPTFINQFAGENQLTFTRLERLDEDGYEWCGYYTREEDDSEVKVEINVYDPPADTGDDRWEVIFRWPTTYVDGPAMIVADLEDIIVPLRCENLQPISGANPDGAPWFAKRVRIPYSLVEDRQRDGVYDLLTRKDLEEIKATATSRTFPSGGTDESQIDQTKDATAGLSDSALGSGDADGWVTVYELFGPRDGVEVVITILEEARKMARARYLSEMHPSTPPRRPVAEARFIPVPGHFYGMGLPELMEGINDFLHDLINDNIDAGRIASIPWFGYAASSGLKPQDLRLGPGDGIPLQNPQADLAFYQIPGRDQSWSFNMIGMATQWLERLVQIGAMQFGQVPQGKASALRTVGTTMAILQQGAALPEQVLRRLMMGVKAVYEQFHQINTRFLTPKKRFLVTGRPIGDPDAYAQIDDRADINIPLVFDFQATLSNTNKGMMAEAIGAMAQMAFSPLFVQAGCVGPNEIYRLGSDFAKANQVDPDRYLRRPIGMTDETVTTVESVLRDLSMGIVPSSTTFPYPAQEAMAKLIQFAQSPELGLMSESVMPMFQDYLLRLHAKVMAEQERMMLMQAAAEFQKGQGGGGGEPGAPPGPGQDPGMQTQAPTQDEIKGGGSKKSDGGGFA